jgi:hypothetical protein
MKRERISDGTRDFMVAVALSIEFFSLQIDSLFTALITIIGLTPPIGPILGVGLYWFGELTTGLIATVGYLIFIFWFHQRGYSIRDWDLVQIALILGTWILELIPLFSILPWFTIGVIRTIYMVRRKDREYNERYAIEATQQARSLRARHRRDIAIATTNNASAVGSTNASANS